MFLSRGYISKHFYPVNISTRLSFETSVQRIKKILVQVTKRRKALLIDRNTYDGECNPHNMVGEKWQGAQISQDFQIARQDLNPLAGKSPQALLRGNSLFIQ